MNPELQSPGDRVFRCEVCQATFTRQEHLTRHRRGHTTERPYQCADCDKNFSRLDVLHRHAQLHGSKRPATQEGSPRACKECAISRVRCERGTPCERCRERNLACIYPIARKRKNRASLTSGTSPSPPTTESPHPHPYDESIARAVGTRTGGLPIAPAGLEVTGIDPRLQAFNAIHSASAPSAAAGETWFPLPGQLDGSAPLSGNLDMATKAQGTVYNQVLEGDLNAWVQNMPSVNWLSPESADMLSPDIELDWLSMANISTDTLGSSFSGNGIAFNFERPYNVAIPDALGLETTVEPSRPNAVQMSLTDQVDSFAANLEGPPGSPPPQNGTYYVDGTSGRTPYQGRTGRRRGGSTLWSADSTASASGWTPEEGNSGTGLQEAFVSEATYRNLLDTIPLECDLRDLGLDFPDFPSRIEMQELVQLYFDGFHRTYPFLQKAPDMFVRKESWIVLLSITAVGARYASTARYHKIGLSLVSVVDRILMGRFSYSIPNEDATPWIPMGDAPETGGLDLFTLQAAVLNCLVLLHCGEGASTRRALAQRHHIVDAGRHLKLLSHVDPWPAESTERTSSIDILRRWLERESRIRTGWMVWLIDSIAVYEFHSPPLLQIGDIKACLPCREDIWHRPTATLVNNQSHLTVTLMDALEMLYMEKTLPPNLGDLSTSVLIFAVCRRTREALTQHQTELTFWSPSAKKQPRSQSRVSEESWPPALPSLSKWRNSACDCLDILHWSANATSARASGWEHPTILHLHLARLLLLAPTRHIQRLTCPPSTGALAAHSDNTRSMPSRLHVLRWAIRDQYKARLSVIHAGALLWHIRRYSSNSFLEPFGIYAATLVIWAYSVSWQFVKGQAPSKNSSYDTAIPSDTPEQQRRDEVSDDSDRDTEPAVILLDRPCDDEIVQTYICSGHRMSGRMSGVGDISEPTAPRRILKQGMRLLTGSSDKRSRSLGSRSPANSQRGQEPLQPGWGIEQPYFESLRCLLLASVGQEQERSSATSRSG